MKDIAHRRLALRLLLAQVATALTIALLATPAHATNIGVTTTADENNLDVDCSLREAIIATNTATMAAASETRRAT